MRLSPSHRATVQSSSVQDSLTCRQQARLRHPPWPWEPSPRPRPPSRQGVPRRGHPEAGARPTRASGSPRLCAQDSRQGGEEGRAPVGEGLRGHSREQGRSGAPRSQLGAPGMRRWGRRPGSGPARSAGCRWHRSGSQPCLSCCRRRPLRREGNREDRTRPSARHGLPRPCHWAGQRPRMGCRVDCPREGTALHTPGEKSSPNAWHRHGVVETGGLGEALGPAVLGSQGDVVVSGAEDGQWR